MLNSYNGAGALYACVSGIYLFLSLKWSAHEFNPNIYAGKVKLKPRRKTIPTSFGDNIINHETKDFLKRYLFHAHYIMLYILIQVNEGNAKFFTLNLEGPFERSYGVYMHYMHQYNLINTWERRMEQEWEGCLTLWVDGAAVGPGKDFRKPTCDTLKWLTKSLETILAIFSQSRKTSQTMQATKTNRFLYFSPLGCSCCAKKL